MSATQPSDIGIVASADLSPVSPSPLHTASPTLVPTLQVSADNLDVASLEPLNSSFVPIIPPPTAAMEAPQPTEVSDTIVVGGADDGADDDSHDDSMVDEASSDVYADDSAVQPEVLDSTDTGLQDHQAALDNLDAIAMDHEMQTELASATEPADAVQSQVPATASVSAPLPNPSPDVADAAASTSSGSSASDSDSDSDEADDEVAQDQIPASNAPAADAVVPAPATTKQPDEPAPLPEQPGQQDAADAMSDDDDSGSIDSADIQKMVDDMSAQAAAAGAATSGAAQSSALPAPPAQSLPSPTGVSQPASLPPKPSLPASGAQYAAGSRATPTFDPSSLPAAPNTLQYPGHAAITNPAAAPGMPAGGAPGTFSEAGSTLPPPPPASFNGHAPPFQVMSQQYPANSRPDSADASRNGRPGLQTFEQFISDERRYMAEAKWERFPEGSRIFVGNLSAEKVSKRDVFDLFHQYGRLAQISLKSAFGFVQYHTLEDAEGAVRALQGAVINGRKLNLEFSRTQKKGGGDRERDRSPDRSRRGKDGGRGADRYDGREQGGRRSRDDYRPDRSPEPTKRDSGAYGGRNPYDFSDRQRNRSRSPRGHGRQESDQYRRRSPSPYRRSQADQAADRLDIPRRYGSDVPDVQLLLLQEVQREFVSWVQKAFYDRGLKSDVMFLNPRFPRDAVIQRQVLEGVHGVIELDARAQGTGTISLQVFNRSAGASNVRFDQYQALDPKVAAELVLRAKQQAAPSQQVPNSGYQPPTYGAPYQPPPQQQQYSYPPAAPQQQQASPAQPDLSALMSQLDPASLQRLLASLQGGQPSATPNIAGLIPQQAPPRQTMPPQNQAPAAPNSQIDVNAILASLKGPGAAQAPPIQQARPTAGYGAPAPAYGAPQPGLPAGATAEQQQQVESIMATLAKFRQR